MTHTRHRYLQLFEIRNILFLCLLCSITSWTRQAMVSVCSSLTNVFMAKPNINMKCSSNIKLCLCVPSCLQSLVQSSRKAGITSAMASTTLGNEELVGFLASLLHHSVQEVPTFLIPAGIKLPFFSSVPFAEKSRL